MPSAKGRSGKQPLTPMLVGAFFAIATVICSAAGTSLLVPGGQLDWMWRIKPVEHEQLLRLGPIVGFGFLGLAAMMALASLGSFMRRRWGWGLAVFIFVANGLGDAARIFSGAPAEGMLGVVVTAAIVWWLTRADVRALFDR
jgi:hypothetical protein